jgi:hypothetical protein
MKVVTCPNTTTQIPMECVNSITGIAVADACHDVRKHAGSKELLVVMARARASGFTAPPASKAR